MSCHTAPEDTTTGYGQGACDLLNEWVDVARGLKQTPSVDASAMVRVQKVLDAIYESSREGRRVACNIE